MAKCNAVIKRFLPQAGPNMLLLFVFPPETAIWFFCFTFLKNESIVNHMPQFFRELLAEQNFPPSGNIVQHLVNVHLLEACLASLHYL